MTAPFPASPFVIAHRGASYNAPENTLSAFLKAKELGVNWVEFDVRLSANNDVIVFHDEELNRTTNGTGKIQDYPYDYLKTLDAGSWFNAFYSHERILTLQEVLITLNALQIAANIEIKIIPENQIELVKRVLAILKELSPTIPILLSSFSYASLLYISKNDPNALIGFLMDDYLNDWQRQCNELKATTVNVNYTVLTAARIQAIKATGRSLFAYTVNDPLVADHLFNLGVDAVFSDCPPGFLTAIL